MQRLLTLVSALTTTFTVLGAAGCSKNDPGKTDGGGGNTSTPTAKLAKAIAGTWAKDNVSYSFRESGDYSYRGGDLTIKGKWKAIDASTIEMTFTLTKEQVELLKPLFELTKKGIDALNDIAKKGADFSGGLIAFKAIPYPREFKEGDNTWKETVALKGTDTLEISKVPYAKRLGTWGPFQQTGKFVAEVAGSGEIYFPLSYAEPPDVELKRFAGRIEVKITELTTTGFKWNHTGKDRTFGNPEMTFIANGIPRDKEQTAFEQSGSFKVTPGASGEEKFPQAFASPPHVELSVKIGLHKVMITRTTGTGFTWRNDGKDKFFDTREMNYVAKGIKGK